MLWSILGWSPFPWPLEVISKFLALFPEQTPYGNAFYVRWILPPAKGRQRTGSTPHNTRQNFVKTTPLNMSALSPKFLLGLVPRILPCFSPSPTTVSNNPSITLNVILAFGFQGLCSNSKAPDILLGPNKTVADSYE